MKTKLNIYITMMLLLIVGASCSDNFLEEKKNYGQTDDTFFQSVEQVNWYINRLYYNFYYGYTSPQATLVGSFKTDNSYFTEEIGGMKDLINPNIAYTTADDIAKVTGYYGSKLGGSVKNEPYDRIRDLNSLLERIDVVGSSLDQGFRNQAKGQAYYLRAMQYFDLMRTYGGVPIVTTVQNATSTDSSIQLPRASVTEVVSQIVKDFDMAASLLPTNWDAANYGRFTKGAAMAQKARVLLTYASPLFNKNWDSSTDRWDAALQAGLAAEVELTADNYGLYGNSAKDWQDMFLIDNKPCREAITVKLLASGTTNITENNSWEKGLRLVSQGGGGSLEAPKAMIDLFPMKDGSKPTVSNGYDEFLFFKNRDPRFYRTFAFSGSKWGYQQSPNAVVWSYRWLDANNKEYYSDNNNESSPAYVRKMSNPAASNASAFQYSGTDIFEYRYAELLLNIAECYAAKGDVANTISYIGKVRNRVGIPAANNYGLGVLSGKYAALSACLYERRVELAYEGKRFWDVQRWMLYNDDSFANNNTCAKLGLTPINGTQRIGHYLQYKTAATSTDPLAAARANIVIDPDSANFTAQIQTLADFYTENFILTDLKTPMDNINGDPTYIDWKSNYYINGLQTSPLTLNPWLKQTMGWKGISGDEGTFNYQD